VVKIQVGVFWLVRPCSDMVGYQYILYLTVSTLTLKIEGDNGGSKVLQDVGTLLHCYATSQPRRP